MTPIAALIVEDDLQEPISESIVANRRRICHELAADLRRTYNDIRLDILDCR